MAQKSISILFLISFQIGLLQPVLPLVEYYVFKESIIELFCENRNVPDSGCEGTCYLSNQLKKNAENSESPGNLINFEEIPNAYLTKSPSVSRLLSSDDELRCCSRHHRPDEIPYKVFQPPRT